jgi:hypothetical protein
MPTHLPTVLIAYDMAAANSATSTTLAAAIRQLGPRWARPLASLWYVETGHSVENIEAALAPFLNDDDGLLVQEATGQASLTNTMLRWTSRSPLIASEVAAQRRPWQPRIVPGHVPAGGHLPNSETEVAAAA